MGHTRTQYREEIANVFGMKESSVTAGTTTTFDDAAMQAYGEDFFNGWWALLQLPAGGATIYPQEVFITNFALINSPPTPATARFTADQTFAITPTNGVAYQLFRYVSPTQINRAVQRACQGALRKSTLTPSFQTTDYSLAAVTGLHHPNQIKQVWLRRLNQVIYPPHQVTNYTVEDNNGVLTLHMGGRLNPSDGFWIIWEQDEDAMGTDASECDLHMGLVTARAVVYLIKRLLTDQSDSGMNKWGMLLKEWESTLQMEEREYQHIVGKAKFHNWDSGVRRTDLDRLHSTGVFETY